LFGFQYVDNIHTACTQPAGVSSSWALLCSSNPAAPSHLVAPNADQTYLFADDSHLTTAGQKIVADYEHSLVVAPSEISFLAEAPVKTRAAVIDSIFNQIALSRRHRRVGSFNAWVTGGVSELSMNSGYNGFSNDPGVPVSGTVGVDYAIAPGWLVGSAVSVGTTSQSYSLGGSFQQNEFALSVFSAVSKGPLWADVIGTYGGSHYDIDRIVPIGITMQDNRGRTFGTNVSLAAESGYDFFAGPIRHGPLAGLVLQRVYVDGFTETDAFASTGGLTALSFAGQLRNSAVSELGYQASADLGRWRPFAKLAWNHELASLDRSVTASLTTVAAPAYAMPAVISGRDWATGTVGAAVSIAPGTTAYASFSGQAGQTNVINYGGQIGVNVALNTAEAVAAKP
jgi:outer membrane lipase/esterase